MPFVFQAEEGQLNRAIYTDSRQDKSCTPNWFHVLRLFSFCPKHIYLKYILVSLAFRFLLLAFFLFPMFQLWIWIERPFMQTAVAIDSIV